MNQVSIQSTIAKQRQDYNQFIIPRMCNLCAGFYSKTYEHEIHIISTDDEKGSSTSRFLCMVLSFKFQIIFDFNTYLFASLKSAVVICGPYNSTIYIYIYWQIDRW